MPAPVSASGSMNDRLAESFDAVLEPRSRSARNAQLLGGFLLGVAGAVAAGRLLRSRGEPRPEEEEEENAPRDEVDEASDESFPSSDPPSFTPSHPGAPDHHEDDRAEKGDR